MPADTTPSSIVTLTETKTYLNFGSDTSQDTELQVFIDAMRPVVESVCGTVVPTSFYEYYAGGSPWITLRHRPLIEVEKVTEYIGAAAFVLTPIDDPTQGTPYSYLAEPSGRIVRRTAGGGVTAFCPGSQSVRIAYRAGYMTIPANIRLGTLELIRVNYQQTQLGDRPAVGATTGGAGDDAVGGGQIMLGFLVPNRVREMLAPSRRHPSIA